MSLPSFAHPAWLLVLLLLPLLWLLHGRSGPRASLLYSNLGLFGQSGRPVRRRSGAIASMILPSLVLVCWAVALARPQEVRTWQEAESSGIEIMIALDVSDSMAAEDFLLENGARTTRLERAKAVSREFIESRAGDRLGLVIFSGQPALLGPMTVRRQWLIDHRLPLARVDLDTLEEGTAIGSAIAASILHLSESAVDEQRATDAESAAAARAALRGQPGSRIIVLVTDGANNAGSLQPAEAAAIAAEFGIRIYTIAVGTPGEHLTPITIDGNRSLRRLESYEEDDLREIAELTDGAFYRASDPETLAEAFSSIDDLEKADLETYVLTEAEDQFQLWTALGLVSLVLLILGRPLTDLKLPE